MRDLYTHLSKDKTEGREMIVCALVIGVSSLGVTGVDLVWLIGDYRHAPAPHHFYIGLGLVIGLIIMLASFIWLYKASCKRAASRAAKIKKLWERTHMVHRGATHCDVNTKRAIIKPDYSRYEGLD